MKRNDLLRQKGLIYATKIINLENKIKVLQKQLQTRHIENRNIKRKNGKFEVNAIELYKKMKSNKRLHTYRLYKQIARTQLFDTNFYIEQYTHTKTNAKRAIWDYIQNGVLENRKPNTFFNPQFYLSENIDVALSGMEPLLHYALFGWKEGRNPSTKFDTKKYLVNHPDVARSGMNPLLHYLKYGREENRKVYNVHNATVPISSETFSSPSVVFPQNEESTGSCILNDVVFSSIRRFHGLSPIIQRERLDLVVLNESNFFEVLPFITQRKGKLIVELEIETNSPGLINLQYITVNDQKYNASKCLTKKLSESANSVRFELGTKYLTGLQRINLSKLSGKVSIKRITQSFIENVDESTDPIMSFIVPCYNHGEYLEETINSIRAIEEDELYEIIVVDDGSTDLHTKQVFNKLQNDGITILAQPNKGLGAARNNGISLARGKYIFPVDADNRIRTVHFYRAVEIMETDETVGVVYGDVQSLGRRNTSIGYPSLN
ncbi:glycosyltransferase family A protein [Desulfosarcina cetonica]|uniref:glycosyltransferase family A protein n=1 Tax=Desulfosarcina cetonica TaxID=90730 RepID=UPI0006CFEE5B|nr:glycosyltransferase family A protein [Desulfosarcina cetonica]